MRPRSITVTSGIKYYPVDGRGGVIGVTATPSGAGNYTVAYAQEYPVDGNFANVNTWTDITDMSAATAVASKEVGPITCLRITLNSGTSVKVDIVQNDK